MQFLSDIFIVELTFSPFIRVDLSPQGNSPSAMSRVKIKILVPLVFWEQAVGEGITLVSGLYIQTFGGSHWNRTCREEGL